MKILYFEENYVGNCDVKDYQMALSKVIPYKFSLKVRSCYCGSIPSNPADQKFFITSKNNNKIAGKWDF